MKNQTPNDVCIELYRHQELMLKVLRARGVPIQDAEDCCQDVYLRLLQSTAPTVRDYPAFAAQTANNAATNYFRDKRREPVMVPALLEDAFGNIYGNPDIDNRAVHEWQALQISSLSERIQQGLELAETFVISQPRAITASHLIARLLAGDSIKQMAEYYEVSRETVSRWLTRWYDYVGAILPRC